MTRPFGCSPACVQGKPFHSSQRPAPVSSRCFLVKWRYRSRIEQGRWGKGDNKDRHEWIEVEPERKGGNEETKERRAKEE